MPLYPLTILTTSGLQAYYRLNETSGTTAFDQTSNHYNAKVSGATFSQKGALIGDIDTCMLFAERGGITLPLALAYTSWPAFSLEFWVNTGGPLGWTYVVVTYGSTNGTLFYTNGAVTNTDSRGSIFVDAIFDLAGSLTGTYALDEIAVYSVELAPSVISAHYAAGASSTTVVTASPFLPSGIPTTNLFGIGTYQSISGGTVFAEGTPSQSVMNPNVHPYAGVYGGTYGYVLDTTIRPPQTSVWTPASEVGRDSTSLSVVRGFPQLTWTWNTLRPDYWYYFMNLYHQAHRTPPGFQSLVLLMYPDGSSNTLQLTLARMNPPTHSARDVGSYQGVTLTFSYLGEAVLVPGQLVQVLT